MGSGNSSAISSKATLVPVVPAIVAPNHRATAPPVRISVKEASTRLEDIPSGTNFFQWNEKNSMAASVASDVADLDTVGGLMSGSDSSDGVRDELQRFLQLVDEAGSELLDESDELLRSVQSHLKREFLSDEQQAALSRVAQMFWSVLPDLPVSPFDFYLVLLLIFAYRFGTPRTPGLPVIDFELVRRANRYMRFASAAYGSKLVKAWKSHSDHKISSAMIEAAFSMPTTTDRINNSRSVALHAGVKFEDIVCSYWKSEDPFSTGHYVAYDHSTRAVVVVLRGTTQIHDVTADLVAEPVPFSGGFAHRGMLEIARRKIVLLRPILEKCFRDHPHYHLVITGHSLGAGAAVLMSMCVKEEMGVPVKCYAFACPAVVSRDLAEMSQSYVYSFVCNDDVVPRLSIGALHDFEKLVRHLLRRHDGFLVRLFQAAAVGNQLGPELTDRIASFLQAEPIPDFSTLNADRSPLRLFPAGRCFHLQPDENGRTTRRGPIQIYPHLEEVRPTSMDDLVFSYDMLRDHLPDSYESSLAAALVRMTNNENDARAALKETLSPDAYASVVEELVH